MTSQELIRAESRGAVIVSALGDEMAYRPRYRGDRYPWVVLEQPHTQKIYRARPERCRAHWSH